MNLAQFLTPPEKLKYETAQELPKAWERWKRSFDMAHPSATRKDAIPSSDQPLSLVSLSHLDNAP